MSLEQPKTLACPVCGNVNIYTADVCVRCGLNLAPIRAALATARNDMGWQSPDERQPTRIPVQQQGEVSTVTNNNASSKKAAAQPIRTQQLNTAEIVSGTIRGFQQREEVVGGYFSPPRLLQIWTFVVDRYDKEGSRLSSVPVEMRGRRFRGVISEGDSVKIATKWHQGDTIHPHILQNLTTGATVSAQTWSVGGMLLMIMVLLLIFAVILAIASSSQSW